MTEEKHTLKVEIAKITFDLIGDPNYLMVDVDCIHRFNNLSTMKTHVGKFERKYTALDVLIGMGNGDLPPVWSWPEKAKEAGQ
jgi:hypothetical protein